MQNSAEDKLKDKLSEEEKKTVLDAVKEGMEWLDENSDAEADEYKDKLKEVRGVWGMMPGFRWAQARRGS